MFLLLTTVQTVRGFHLFVGLKLIAQSAGLYTREPDLTTLAVCPRCAEAVEKGRGDHKDNIIYITCGFVTIARRIICRLQR